MPSFDIVSELDHHELANAIDQANREVNTRFDFKGTASHFKLEKETIILQTETDFQLKQMVDILRSKLTKRQVDLGYLKIEEPLIQHKKAEQKVTLKQGIDSDTAKKIQKIIKDQKIKVQAAIQGEQIRITGKKRDDLQEVIALLKKQEVGLPLQFTNFRD